MWQRFTERARRVVFYAQEEAGRLGENFVGTEHLLLGLLREQDHVAARILEGLGFSLGVIRHEIERQVTRGDGKMSQDMQLTPRSKRVIDLAYDEAKLLNNNYIGTEHLLLGLIRERDGLAAQVLYKVGVTLEPVRQEIRILQQTGSKTATDPSEPQVSFRNPSDYPPSEGEVSAQLGDLGIACAPANGGQLVLAVSEEAYQELRQIVAIKDDYAYYELVKAGKVFPAVTFNAKLLNKGAYGGYLVRLLDGEQAGKAGWLAPEQFERTGPDERPFPPLSQASPTPEPVPAPNASPVPNASPTPQAKPSPETPPPAEA